jgi:ribonuclease HI/deoxyadenosine/deoxycytidine kinase
MNTNSKITRIISIEGNIGSGKSTFVEMLKTYYLSTENSKNLKICFLQEPVDQWTQIKDENNKSVIECFYANPDKYAFSFQMMAYISRLSVLKKAFYENSYDIIFTERCLLTDKNVFCKMLYDDKKINEIDYQIYNKWFNEFIDIFPKIDYIYIKTRPETASARIIKRKRDGETIPLQYLQKCDDYHDAWLESSNKLVIDGNVDVEINNNITKEWLERVNLFIDNYTLTFDGASRGNPGRCGAGYVIWKNNEVFHEEKHYVSNNNTNNFAEYSALLIGLVKCNALNIKKIIIKGDSNLVVKQIKKEYNIQSQNLIGLFNKVNDELSKFDEYEIYHIPREENSEADRLANLAINKMGKLKV